MAITQAICNSFKTELLRGIQDLDNDIFKLALFRAAPDIVGQFGAYTTNYTDMGADEAVGAVYPAGGVALTAATVTGADGTSFVDFADVVLAGETISTSGALIYNASKGNRAVAVWDFGATKVVTGGTFTIQFPPADAANALLRLA